LQFWTYHYLTFLPQFVLSCVSSVIDLSLQLNLVG
jgi:hypothetical protein